MERGPGASGGPFSARPEGDLGWPLRRAAALYGDAVAVVADGRTVTYRTLAERVGGLGAVLGTLGAGSGARVAFLGANSLAHLECWLGVPASGRVLVDLNYRLGVDELAFMVDDCEPAILLTDAERLETAAALRRRCPSVRELVLDGPGDGPLPRACLAYEELVAAGSPVEPSDHKSDRLAAISYTGGTTGRPKGVMLSHGNLLANARHNLIATGHRPGDNWLHVCPMFHVAGTANVLACTWAGSHQTLLPRFDAAAVAQAIDRERITHTVLVPTMLAMLLEHLEAHANARLDSLRHIQYAASPISPELQRRVLERFGCDVVQFYGMTEAAPTVSSVTAEDHRRGLAGEAPHRRRLASAGAPVIGVEAQVRGREGQRLEPGEVGEIWVRGPNVMLGYWRRPEATAAAMAGEWYRTGDAGYADADGYLYVVDRFKDMIITGGENVYSIEVERVLAEHPAVAEAAVFGIPHPRWVEAVHAVVRVADGARVTEEELIAHARGRIAAFKVPRSVELRHDPLPKSGAGKILKHVLREPYLDERSPGSGSSIR